MTDARQETVADLRSFWSLDADTVYLNHGSFGPSPQPVQDAFVDWNRRVERQPMRFFCEELEERLEETAAHLADRLGTRSNRIVPVDNATFAMNVVACSTDLQGGDEVLLTDHEYGAVRTIWQRRCEATGSRVVTVRLPDPPVPESVTEAVGSALTDQTRLLIVSHVTSATAVTLPVAEICRVARRRRVPVCVDGPHAVGMRDVRLDELGCDFYCASGHKWLCAAFGSGFLWAHPRHQTRIRSPVISWGGSLSGRPPSWKDGLHWPGTRNPAALLSLSAALEFLTDRRLELFRAHAHRLVTRARRSLLEIPGVGSFCTPSESEFVSMCAVELPQPPGWQPGYHGRPDPLQLRLRAEGIEVPVGSWGGRRCLRVSAHLYNTTDDIDRFLRSVRRLLAEEKDQRS